MRGRHHEAEPAAVQRALRGLRLVRIVGTANRSMNALKATLSRRGFGYVAGLTLLVIFLGAAGMLNFENAAEVDGGFTSYGHALWWTGMLVASIGSDFWPHTTEGRLLTMLLAGMVLSNLVEEEANKIIEVLAAAIPMDAVFMGKLFAMLGVSFVGIAVWGAAAGVFAPLAPGGCVVMIGGQPDPIAYDAGAAMVREARVENIFRYAHAFPHCVAMIASGAIDVKPLITRTFDFKDSVQAFRIAASAPPGDVKMQIVLPQQG